MLQLVVPFWIVVCAVVVIGGSGLSAEASIIKEKQRMDTPAKVHGSLSVRGNKIVNQYGHQVQLMGVSSHGLQWFPQFINQTAFEFMRDNWGLSVVRLAMYTKEGGYLDNGSVKDVVYRGIEAAIAAGIYVIVDWHILSDGNPQWNEGAAKDFFVEIATKYKDVPNLIYEICNEPNGWISWSGNIRPYAEDVGWAIRRITPNLIVVGNAQWSSQPQEAAWNQVTFPNVAYTLHFYAASHGQSSRDNAQRALDAGVPVFATEWAASSSSGDGWNNYGEADAWCRWMRDNSVSWTTWSLSTTGQSSSILQGWGNDPNGPFDHLTEEGNYIVGKMRE